MEKFRIIEGIAAYFITFTVVEWLPVFINDATCKIITESLNFCVSYKDLRVNAYVIMPTHMHAVLFDSEFDTERFQQTIDDFRKFTGRQLADYCDKNLASAFGEALRKHAGKDRQRRFWQPTKHPEDWRFSSAAYWLKNDLEASDVKLSEIIW